MTTNVLIKNLATNHDAIKVAAIEGGAIAGAVQTLQPGERCVMITYPGHGIAVEEVDEGENAPVGDGIEAAPPSTVDDFSEILPLDVSVEDVAEACHEANREYCASLGDDSQPAWDDAPDWQKASARNGVIAVLSHPDMTPEDSHNNWLAEKDADGWTYGETKDPQAKTHPCMVAYHELPEEQRRKDELFIETVRSFMVPAPATPA